ncbi:MAG: hypothetical protein R3D68_05280 [Hyphomicrobiaceae bacterium]
MADVTMVVIGCIPVFTFIARVYCVRDVWSLGYLPPPLDVNTSPRIAATKNIAGANSVANATTRKTAAFFKSNIRASPGVRANTQQAIAFDIANEITIAANNPKGGRSDSDPSRVAGSTTTENAMTIMFSSMAVLTK